MSKDEGVDFLLVSMRWQKYKKWSWVKWERAKGPRVKVNGRGAEETLLLATWAADFAWSWMTLKTASALGSETSHGQHNKLSNWVMPSAGLSKTERGQFRLLRFSQSSEMVPCPCEICYLVNCKFKLELSLYQTWRYWGAFNKTQNKWEMIISNNLLILIF